MNNIIKVGTRESKLALAQSHLIMNSIKEVFPKVQFEVIKIKTKGDMILNKKIELVGGKGLFVKELEQALLQGDIDLAVHSMKDIPTDLPQGLTIGAVSKRADPRDVLVTIDGRKIEDLPSGSVIGTSSIRRELLILEKRPDFKVKLLRGNVITRLNKLDNGQYDAIILAAAGLERLGLKERCNQYFDEKDFIPAVAQGIMGVQIREGDQLQEILDRINDENASYQLQAEREYMIRLDGGCSTPFAAHAIIEGEIIKIYGMYATGENNNVTRAYIEGNKKDAKVLGIKLADIIKNKALKEK